MIDKIIITVSDQGDTEIALYGELDALLHFMTSSKTAENRGSRMQKAAPHLKRDGCTASVVAGVGFEPTTFRL